MPFYAEEMRKALTARAGDWLARHAWPRLTLITAFTLSALGAYDCAHWIVSWGGFALRFSVVFLVGYAIFVVYLVLWLWTKPLLDPSDLLDGAPKAIETKDPWDDEAAEGRQQLIEQTTRSTINQGQQAGVQGLLVLSIVGVILGTLFVAMHMLWYARWYLGRLMVLGVRYAIGRSETARPGLG